jgi:transporter family-2 protein
MSLVTLLHMALAFGLGALGGIHIPMNGALSLRIGSSLFATWIFYGVAFAAASVLCLIQWDARAVLALRHAPLWYYMAGLISLAVVGGQTWLITRIGAINLFVMIFTAQMTVRMVISHFGWFGSPVSPVQWSKLAGAALLMAGTVLMVRD